MDRRPILSQIWLLKRAKRFAHESLGRNVVFELKLTDLRKKYSALKETVETDKERAVCVLLIDRLEQLRSECEKERAPLLSIARMRNGVVL